MTQLITLYDRLTARANGLSPELLPLLARVVFAAVLAGYFWSSALTKFDGPLSPSSGAYAQIFPRAFEAAGYNTGALGVWHWLVALGGGYAELILPALILLGLLTRLAALGMMGFIIVQSLTDVIGHGADATTIGSWFDRAPDALILDQRALWFVLLSVLLSLGAGRISIDAILARRR